RTVRLHRRPPRRVAEPVSLLRAAADRPVARPHSRARSRARAGIRMKDIAMSTQATTPHQFGNGQQPMSPRQKSHRKQQVLTQKRPSQVESIADAVVIKDEDVFFLCAQDGQVPLRGAHGFGLYYHDCRYLNGYALKMGRQQPGSLAATPRRGYMAVLELTSPR